MSGTDAAAVAAPSAAECVPVLSRDAIAEILARVPADEAFLFRCAVVCKIWCHLLIDPVTLRRLLPAETDRRPSILGFFGERLLPSSADQTKEKENSTVLPVIAVNQIDQQLYLRRFSSAAAGTGGASRDWSAAPTISSRMNGIGEPLLSPTPFATTGTPIASGKDRDTSHSDAAPPPCATAPRTGSSSVEESCKSTM
jgi:hypothetical protein